MTPYELSHQDIARYLRKIIIKAKKVCGFNSKVPFKPIIIRFKAKGLKNSQTRLLKVFRTVYVGRQWSIFKNLDHVEEKDMTLEDKMYWNEEYTIKDVQTGISILISGNENDGILHYIRSYGFYEGGILNDYRIVPLVAYFIITGNMTPGAIQSLIEKIETKIEHCYIEYQEDIKKIDASSADQDEKKALTKIFRTKWKTSKEELEEEIRHLKSISVVK